MSDCTICSTPLALEFELVDGTEPKEDEHKAGTPGDGTDETNEQANRHETSKAIVPWPKRVRCVRLLPLVRDRIARQCRLVEWVRDVGGAAGGSPPGSTDLSSRSAWYRLAVRVHLALLAQRGPTHPSSPLLPDQQRLTVSATSPLLARGCACPECSPSSTLAPDGLPWLRASLTLLACSMCDSCWQSSILDTLRRLIDERRAEVHYWRAVGDAVDARVEPVEVEVVQADPPRVAAAPVAEDAEPSPTLDDMVDAQEHLVHVTEAYSLAVAADVAADEDVDEVRGMTAHAEAEAARVEALRSLSLAQLVYHLRPASDNAAILTINGLRLTRPPPLGSWQPLSHALGQLVMLLASLSSMLRHPWSRWQPVFGGDRSVFRRVPQMDSQSEEGERADGARDVETVPLYVGGSLDVTTLLSSAASRISSSLLGSWRGSTAGSAGDSATSGTNAAIPWLTDAQATMPSAVSQSDRSDGGTSFDTGLEMLGLATAELTTAAVALSSGAFVPPYKVFARPGTTVGACVGRTADGATPLAMSNTPERVWDKSMMRIGSVLNALLDFATRHRTSSSSRRRQPVARTPAKPTPASETVGSSNSSSSSSSGTPQLSAARRARARRKARKELAQGEEEEGQASEEGALVEGREKGTSHLAVE